MIKLTYYRRQWAVKYIYGKMVPFVMYWNILTIKCPSHRRPSLYCKDIDNDSCLYKVHVNTELGIVI